MKKRKTKAQIKFDDVKRVATYSDDRFWVGTLSDFGLYMYQLALQGKLFTLQKKDGDEYMRCVNADKE